MAGIDVQVGTLSKAFGAEGGYIAASREICDYLRNTSRPFIFSTAISAVTGAAALAALRLLKADPEKYLGRLRENTAYMRNLLTETGVGIAAGDTPIIPVAVGDEKEALATAEACRKEGILLSAIRPPSVPVGTSRIRLTVTGMHTKEEMKKAAAILIRHWRSK